MLDLRCSRAGCGRPEQARPAGRAARHQRADRVRRPAPAVGRARRAARPLRPDAPRPRAGPPLRSRSLWACRRSCCSSCSSSCPIAEPGVILQIGQAIGVLPTIALLIARLVARRGAHALAGPRGLAALQRGARGGARPRPRGRRRRVVIFGGALLLTPRLPQRLPRPDPAAAADARRRALACCCARFGRAARSRARPAARRRGCSRSADRVRAAPRAAASPTTTSSTRVRRDIDPRRSDLPDDRAAEDRLHLPDAPDPAFRDAVTFAFGDPRRSSTASRGSLLAARVNGFAILYADRPAGRDERGPRQRGRRPTCVGRRAGCRSPRRC